MKTILTLLASALLAGCLPVHMPGLPATRAEVIGQPISRATAVADVDTMMRVLEDVHPDLYALFPRDSAQAERRRIVAALPDQLSRIDLWDRLAPLLARFGDGHTTIYIPGEDIARLQNAGALQFPAQVALDDDGHLVTTAVFGSAAGETGLRRGDRLRSVDGRDVDSLMRAWMLEFSGESDRFRGDQVAGSFRVLAMIHGITAPYTTDVIGADGVPRTVVATGVSQDSLRAIVLRSHTGQGLAGASLGVTYRKQQPGVGYLNIRSFTGEPKTFADRMNEVFTQVAADSDRALIIDLRTNGGGDSRLADDLLSHFNTAPYRMSARKDWKMSAEYRAYLKDFLSPPLQWVHAWNILSAGRRMMRGPDGSIVTDIVEPEAHAPAQPFFSGKVCVLIGAGTFSSAADLADGIKTYHLATLVGEETGGRVNAFGEVYYFRLPNSQLLIQVSSARFVRASGDTTDHHGVVPDLVVRTPASARARGIDVALDSAVARCAPN